MADQTFDRFRSFAERYVVARAGSFRAGFEREDAWQATLDAKTIYANVARMSIDAEPLELEIAKMASQSRMGGNATQAGPSASHPGATSVGPPLATPHRGPMGPMSLPLIPYENPPLVPPGAQEHSWFQRLMRKESANGTP